MKEVNKLQKITENAVFKASEEVPPGSIVVRGYDFEESENQYEKILQSYLATGFQATHFGKAVGIINKMINWKATPEEIAEDPELSDASCKIFLGYTSNLISSGLRETIKYLVKHKKVQVLVTTVGGIEEDLIKCLGNTYIGKFNLDGAELRKKGINRIGNLIVPNNNYCKFEDWIIPIFDKLLEEQNQNGTLWTPSKIIDRLGKEINHEDSVYYWAHKNGIPVYCPAFTDGSIGDMLYFHSFKSPGLVIDIVSDIRGMNGEAVFAKKTGAIILGGGVVKHHICNANLMRNGTDYAVYINTGQEFDGSDAGASPDEAVSWGKIRVDGESIKVSSDATLVFPLLVAQTFAKQ
ncbi:Deoxyhypusine synthase [Zancudomyces culisetae]|uniref:deoxyhypusine synthase n=1 Tax=Zancudomyces culisetae TaxID=1213189 RepID=A0A1R1PVZ8_ZANCU|nr:Deoxyhypusine synthase [Zancudomyces culisetae]OMH85141.1 Deoxyhypusine synthase [Zancudomyces culisetae]|eukprot:OMH80629.1 Deoxyhypusine synthase [Zancudomyces culisetae]